jgi:hypothetical protein
MNASLVNAAPQGDFTEVSILTTGWKSKFQSLINKKRPVKCDIYPLPAVPEEIYHALNHEGYTDLIVANDQWQHFLVPNSSIIRLASPSRA